MVLGWKVWVAALALAAPAATFAATCTSQAELAPQDRSTLAAMGQSLADAVARQDPGPLQTALLPSLSSDWEGMRGAVEQSAPLLKGGQMQVQYLYLLDASSQTAQTDTQFFCSNASGSLTVTITMRTLPPGKYAVVLANAAGASMAGQVGMILVLDTTGSAPAWKLGGLSIRQGVFDGHDARWYWIRARELAQDNKPWAAFYCYDAARYLQLPVDFISSPNMEKLGQEQAQIKGSPADAFPYSLTAGDRTWKIDAVRLDASLREPDLGVTYESVGAGDPAVLHTEAVAVLSALLKAQPGLRESFHGMWAYASKDGKITPVIELPMAQIP